MHFVADILQLAEQLAESHAVTQGLGGGILDDRAICHGVAEGDADFYHIDALRFEGADNVYGVVGFRVSGTEINGKNSVLLLFE